MTPQQSEAIRQLTEVVRQAQTLLAQNAGPPAVPTPPPAPPPATVAATPQTATPQTATTKGWSTLQMILAATGLATAVGGITSYEKILAAVPTVEPPAWLTSCGMVMFACTLAAGAIGGLVNCLGMAGGKWPPLLRQEANGQAYATLGLIPNLVMGAAAAFTLIWMTSCPGSHTDSPAIPASPFAAPSPPGDAPSAILGAAATITPAASDKPLRYWQAVLALFAAGGAGFTASRSLTSNGRANILWDAVESALRGPSRPDLANKIPTLVRSGDVFATVEAAKQTAPGTTAPGTSTGIGGVLALLNATRTRDGIRELRERQQIAPVQRDGSNLSLGALADAETVPSPYREKLNAVMLASVPKSVGAFLDSVDPTAQTPGPVRDALVHLWSSAQQLQPLLAALPENFVFDERAFS